MLEDGTVFPRPIRRRSGRGGGRGVLLDRVGGLRAGGHGPELRPPGADVRLPADRQLRRRRAPARVGARVDRGRRHAPRAAGVVGVARRARHRRARGDRHPSPRAAAARGRRPALRARHRAPRGAARPRARAAAPRLAADAGRARAGLAATGPRGVHGRAVLARLRPSRRRARPRLQALDRPPARGVWRRGVRRARHLDGRRRARARPGRGV